MILPFLKNKTIFIYLVVSGLSRGALTLAVMWGSGGRWIERRAWRGGFLTTGPQGKSLILPLEKMDTFFGWGYRSAWLVGS